MTAPRTTPEPFPRFWPRPPWFGGDLQTLRNYLVRPRIDLGAFPAESVEFPMRDGSGDVLLGTLSRPPAPVERPLVILVHGLAGCEDSTYVRASARHLLRQGYPVLRLNLRGAGRSRARCRQHYHAGRSQDLRDAIGRMDGRLTARGLLAVGFSLGASLLLKYLGEEGIGAPLLGAVSLSAPLDLQATQRRMMAPRNHLYHGHMLACLKSDFIALEAGNGRPPPADLAAIRTVYAFDERIVAPRNGFAGADDYYARSAARPYLGAIRVPTLVIHAQNDPWIPAATYRAVDWRANRRLTLLLPWGGGHVGFHGIGPVPWHDRCIATFFGRLTARPFRDSRAPERRRLAAQAGVTVAT